MAFLPLSSSQNAIMLFLGYFGVRFFAKVVEVPAGHPLPVDPRHIADRQFTRFAHPFSDVGACFAFGIVGWIFKRYGYPVAPIVLGIVLGSSAGGELSPGGDDGRGRQCS